MTKSSAVLFILIFSLIFKLEELVRPQLPLSLLPQGVSKQWLIIVCDRGDQPSPAINPVAEEGPRTGHC